MKSAHIAGLLAGLSILGCESIQRGRPALGEANEVIVITVDSLWAEVGDSLRGAVAPRFFAVHDERPFEVQEVSPASEMWLDLRRFRQVIAVGTAADSWIADVLGDRPAPEQLPALVTADNVWARGQTVTALVLPPDRPAAAFESMLPELGTLMDERFRQYARNRMFLSDTNTALRAALEADDGFSLTLPNIYRPAEPGDQLQAFHNRNEVGGDLFRTIVVSWRSGTSVDADASRVVAWRDSILPIVYDVPQVTATDRIDVRELDDLAPGSIEVQGVWRGTDPTFPTAGPFIDRIVVCPDQDRTYFLEAWMYGPSREKYEYLIQFETILDSFRCGG